MKCKEPLQRFCLVLLGGIVVLEFLSPAPFSTSAPSDSGIRDWWRGDVQPSLVPHAHGQADFPQGQTKINHVVFVTADGEEKAVDLTFDNLKFDIEKDQAYDESMLTDEIRELEGKRIKIHGFIRPSFKQKGIKSFVFVRDNKECCFGPGAALYDCLIVKMKKGKSATFTVRPIAVEGEFSIKAYEGPDGNTWAIFQLTNSVVD